MNAESPEFESAPQPTPEGGKVGKFVGKTSSISTLACAGFVIALAVEVWKSRKPHSQEWLCYLGRKNEEGRVCARPSSDFGNVEPALEREPEPDLDRARTAAADRGVGDANVGRLARRAKRAGH